MKIYGLELKKIYPAVYVVMQATDGQNPRFEVRLHRPDNNTETYNLLTPIWFGRFHVSIPRERLLQYQNDPHCPLLLSRIV